MKERTLKEMIKGYSPKFLEISTNYNTYEYDSNDFKDFNDNFLNQKVIWYQYCEEKLVVTLK